MASSVDITYKGSKILSATETGSATLKTAGKYMEGDVELEYTLEEGGGTDTSDATMTSGGQMLSGVTAYSKGTKYTGTIPTKSSSDVTASGATVTVPAGYYAAQVQKSVASGTAGTPTATKGAVSNHAVTVTPKVTNTTGYITGGTKNGTAVTVSASELVSGTKSITENGTGIDVTNYASVNVNVSGGGGSGSAGFSDVNFYDYDGTIVQSYSASDFASLSAMPANPTHSGLTAQGWNWSLADAKAYVAKYGKLNIGQMYITTDGKTRIYIRLEEGRLAPYLGIAINGTATVEWGDGTTGTVTGTSTSSVKNTQHTYASAGDYTIAISVSGSMALVGNSFYGSQVLWKNSTTGNLNRAYQNAIQKVEIGSNTSIGSQAFYNCYSLSSVTIPDGVTSIGDNAFRNCSSLASITIPDGVTSIGDSAFYNCYSLSSVTIPDGVTSIGTNAFYNCYSLSSVTIPDGVTSISTYAFYNCSSLASVTIPDGVTSISTYAFYNCSSLASVTIPDGVTSIGDNAFRNCSSLASITIPDGVTSISTYAFYYCSSLASITIPDSVTSIGTYAFNSCYGLGFIKFEGATPPTVANSNAWASIPTDCKIYIPSGTLSAYTSATNYPSSSTYTYVEY